MPSLINYASLYVELGRALQKQKWFTKRWHSTSGFFPNAKEPQSAFIQIFRDSWFNEEGKGIHLESWMTNADVVRGTTNVVLHIESSKERTGINGKALVKTLLESVGDQIASWNGYQIKESYTMQPFIKKMSVTPDDFIRSLSSEFTRLAGIADVIDSSILEAKKKS